MSIQLTETGQKYCRQNLLEIDHICVCLPQLPSVSDLQELGLVCDEPMLSYADRGTVSWVIFFPRMYIEFVAVVALATATQYARRTGLDFAIRAQWQQSNASPFGIALRHRSEGKGAVRSRRSFRQAEFPSLQTTGSPLSFSMDNLADQTVPFCFVVPEALSLTALIDKDLESYRRRVAHPLGMEELTHAVLRMEYAEPLSQPMLLLVEAHILQFEAGLPPLLTLTFDDHQQNKRLDLRSMGMPLVLEF